MQPLKNQTIQEWLAKLSARHPQEMRLQLHEIKQVAQRLQLLDFSVPVITVAGTNGKGSTVASITAIYKAAGYCVGCYTSPHLWRINERICLGATPISDDELCAAFTIVEGALHNESLTVFETLTLAALYYFKTNAVDVIVLEVGLGGRLDATNILDATLSIITTIALDHTAYLGDNLESIGAEKAGIIRHNQPVVYADLHPPQTILDAVNLHQARLYCLGTDYSFTSSTTELIVKIQETLIRVPLPRVHTHAAASAIVAAHHLRDRLPIKQGDLDKAMHEVFILGRQQIVEGAVKTVYDVSHNEQSVQLLSDFVIKNWGKSATRTIHAVFSCLNDKNTQFLIRPMLDCIDRWYLACLDSPRATSAEDLSDALFAETKEFFECFKDPLTAYNKALQEAIPGDVIVVYGSFLMVSAVQSGG